jgi:hypothetical protein
MLQPAHNQRGGVRMKMNREDLISVLVEAIKEGSNINDLLAEAQKMARESRVVTLTVKDDSLQPPYRGWRLVSDGNKKPAGTITLELVPLLKKEEAFISGDEMIRRARKLDADLGQHYAELLLANQQEIPEEWREFYFVFPNTVWQNLAGAHGMPSLDWASGQWVLNFRWIGDVWGGRARLLHLCK